MNVLMICHDHPRLTDGGTEHLAYDLCRAMDARPGASARFMAVSTALTHPDVPAGELHSLGDDFLLRTGAYDAFSMRRLDGPQWVTSVQSVLDEVEPDVVHLHGLDRIGAEIIAVLRRLRPDARLVMTLHDYQLISPKDGLLLHDDGSLCTLATDLGCRTCLPNVSTAALAIRKARLLALLAQVDAFVSPSQDLKDRFIAWGLPEDRITLIPNAIPVMPPIKTAKRPRPNRFAFFGNLAKHKGVDVLLTAARHLARKDISARINLHGRRNYPTAEDDQSFVAALAQADPVVQYLGPYHRKDVHALMTQTDWVVVPSLWYENAPLVVLEAQRAGKPVICTDIGGLPELVRNGIDGIHVPRGDARALADCIETLSADPDLWIRLAGNVRPPVRLHTSLRRHMKLYSNRDERLPA